jgi:hypothetical protein
MTINEILEELKNVDSYAYNLLRNYPVYCSKEESITIDLTSSTNKILVADAIQGCIQRVIERRGWEMEQNYRTKGRDDYLPQNMRHYAVITSWDKDVPTYRGMGKSHAEAVLEAYVAAVKEEERKDTPVLVDHPMYDGHGKSIPRHLTVFSDICEGEKR